MHADELTWSSASIWGPLRDPQNKLRCEDKSKDVRSISEGFISEERTPSSNMSQMRMLQQMGTSLMRAKSVGRL